MPAKTTPSRILKTDPTTMSAAPSRRQTLLLWVLLVIAAAGFAWSFFSYQSVKKEVEILKDPQLASKLSEQQTKDLLAKLSKLILLPSDPAPVVAVINDVESLAANQDFYKDADNGDKLIIFQKDRKAIIYDEAANRIINVGPIFYNDAEGNPQDILATDRITIELRNGTAQIGATTTVRDELTDNYSFNVTHLSKAAKSDYVGYTLIDRTDGSKAALITALQQELGATVVKELPAGEGDAKTEVVIIVGRKP